MDHAVPDNARVYGDTFQSPADEDGGIYLLDSALVPAQHDMHTRKLWQGRMRARALREGMTDTEVDLADARSVVTRGAFADYKRQMPSQTLLRSRQAMRPAIDSAMWDPRPAGWRPDDGPRAAALFPPHCIKPQGGVPVLPWQVSYAPSNSAAINAVMTDPATVGLAACPAQTREGYAASPAGALSTASGDAVRAIPATAEQALIRFVLLLILLVFTATCACCCTVLYMAKRGAPLPSRAAT